MLGTFLGCVPESWKLRRMMIDGLFAYPSPNHASTVTAASQAGEEVEHSALISSSCLSCAPVLYPECQHGIGPMQV